MASLYKNGVLTKDADNRKEEIEQAEKALAAAKAPKAQPKTDKKSAKK